MLIFGAWGNAGEDKACTGCPASQRTREVNKCSPYCQWRVQLLSTCVCVCAGEFNKHEVGVQHQ